MSGPLQGIKVVDLTSMVSGPLTTMILADQGAEVIKVENPKGGDFTRSVSSRRNSFSASFLNNNRNKKSIALNLKSDEGKSILKNLARDADVFIQNFRPNVIERMGLGEEELRKFAPDIIYVSISGFGDKGPYSGKPVYDPLVQALSGLTTIQGGSDESRPRLVRTILPDKLTGITCAQAITAALLERYRTGKGQHIRLSMLDAIVSFLWSSDMSSQTFVGKEFSEQKAQSFIDLIYETADGYISVAVQSDKEWLGLTQALERPDWLQDERFKTAALRQSNINERLELTQEVLRTRNSKEWLQRLEKHDVPCAPVLKRREILDHPQILQNNTVIQYKHAQAGEIRQSRAAAQFSNHSELNYRGAPLLGQHSKVLLEAAGYAAGDIEDLLNRGIIHCQESEPTDD